MITEDERLPIRSTKDVRDELHKGGSVSYMAVTADKDADIPIHWRVRCTSKDGRQYRIISSSQHVTDRIFKELSSLFKFHQKLFAKAPDQELHLPLEHGVWSRDHRYVTSDSERAT